MTPWQRNIGRILILIVSLQVLIINLLLMKIMQHIPGRQMLEDKLVKKLTPEAQLAIQAFETYVVPAVQDINKEAKIEAAHRRRLQSGILEIIKGVPNDRQAQLLETLQLQEYDGVTGVLDSIFDGYCNIINAFGDTVTKVAEAENKS